MNPPDVKHVLRDGARNITYRLWAYRKLSPREVEYCILQFIARMKKKPKRRLDDGRPALRYQRSGISDKHLIFQITADF